MKWLLVLLAAAARAHSAGEPQEMTCHDFAAVTQQMFMAADLCNPSWKDRPALSGRVEGGVPVRTTMRCYPDSPCQNGAGKVEECDLPVADFSELKSGAADGERLFKEEVATKGLDAVCVEADAILTKIEAK